MNNTVKTVDFLGKEIIEGSDVVYPGRGGASIWLNFGYVETVREGRIRVRRTPLNSYEKEKSVWVRNLNRVVVVG